MKQLFSKHWQASKQPRKQRKFLANAPLNIRHKIMSVHLSKELRKKYSKRNFPIRKGDSVKIMNGEFKKKTGKISLVDLKKMKVMIDGIFKSKKDGTKIKIYFYPSNLLLQELNLDDKLRLAAINRKASVKKIQPAQKNIKETKQNVTPKKK